MVDRETESSGASAQDEGRDQERSGGGYDNCRQPARFDADGTDDLMDALSGTNR
jgi:hypothetical protein